MPKTPPVLSLTLSRLEAAAAIGVDVQTIDRLITGKKLRASRIGRRVVVRVVDIERMLDANPAAR
jgi:excisionase family DNA binding protein